MKIQEFIAEDRERYVLYLNGQPVSYYSSEDEAEYQGRLIAQRVPDTHVEVKKETCTLTPVELNENLRKWFKEKWVRFGPDGKIRGSCARGSDSEGKPKCLPQSKAHALGKKGRASAAAKKRREDPNPERRGKAKNVATKVKEGDFSITDKPEAHITLLFYKKINGTEYRLVKHGNNYNVYVNRKKHTYNNFKTAKGELYQLLLDVTGEEQLDEKCWKGYHKEGNKEMFGKTVPNCVKNKE